MTKGLAKLAAGALSAVLLSFVGGGAFAQSDAELVIEGQAITTKAPAPEGSPLPELYSGWRFRTPETQALEADDFENPGFVYVDIGQELWASVDGSEGKSCESCHQDVASMEGVRAGMPKWSEAAKQPWSLEHWINNCRTERMGADPWKWESQEMLAMTALVGLQSRGLPVAVDVAGPMAEWFERGKEIYYTRVGQLDMSCANCHETYYGTMIRADHLSQGQTTGFPVYRLKWQGMGSIHRRFKGCMDNIRATPWKRGSDEFVALELYVAWRGQGLSVETPAVRN